MVDVVDAVAVAVVVVVAVVVAAVLVVIAVVMVAVVAVVIVVAVVECYCILIYIIVEPCRPLPPDICAELCLKLVLRTRVVSPKMWRVVLGPPVRFGGSLDVIQRTTEALTVKI